MVNNKKFIITKNRGIVKKLNAANVYPCCSNDDGEVYYLNSEEVLSHLTEDDRHQIAFTDMLMG